MFKRRIEDMRKRQKKRKNDELNANIMTVRMEVAGNIQKSSKMGNEFNCFVPDANSSNKVEEYCSINFSDSAVKFQECKALETFCYTCCDNEFGMLHLLQRENCYKKICDVKTHDIEVCEKQTVNP